MNPQKRERIKKFMADKDLADLIREVLTNSFLKTSKGNTDVQLLAASRIAIDLLEDGFKELSKISRSESEPEERLSQPGL